MRTVPMLRTRWTSPFEVLDDVRREMDRYLTGPDNGWTSAGWMPTDVRETDEELEFMIEVPGLDAEDLDITIEQNVLTVAGEKKFARQNEEENLQISERRYGRFQRSFTLPRTVEAEKVEANYDNGVVHIHLPKTPEAKPRRIEVKPGGGARQIEAS